MSYNRACGVLLPIASLPSKYGIGAFSKEAFKFIDMLRKSGQHYWQILPLGPTGYGDSPYQSFSAFAGNPYFIDLETLIKSGLLTEEECQSAEFGDNDLSIDYEKMYYNRFDILRKAYSRWKERSDNEEHEKNILSEETLNYCFYMAVKDYYNGKSWTLWDEDIKFRKPEAIKAYKERLSDEIGFYQFQQTEFQKQWSALKEYAHNNDIQIIGDIPIYVAFDSADSWAHPELFQFDENNMPLAVAGCPPDGFSPTGQLWGNPLYKWEYHRQTGYNWWLERMRYSFQLYDIVRVDHFRGFDEYYSIPAEDKTAEHGKWESGPGYEIFETMLDKLGKLDIIAEDLGYLTPSVLELVDKTGFPGMKVLQFAFNANGESDYLPHKYTKNCVVYTGTHDNDTVQSWYRNMSPEDRRFSREYLHNQDSDVSGIHWDFIRLAFASVAWLAIIPMQDYLGLGNEARINMPSTLGENWKWRMKPDEFTDEIAEKCYKMAKIYGRT